MTESDLVQDILADFLLVHVAESDYVRKWGLEPGVPYKMAVSSAKVVFQDFGQRARERKFGEKNRPKHSVIIGRGVIKSYFGDERPTNKR